MNFKIIHDDCLAAMRSMPENSIDLIVTDPPYFGVKRDEEWDMQWDSDKEYLHWLGTIFIEFYRLLKPTGSVYVFASPVMSSRVEVMIHERFHVLNHLVWSKNGSCFGNRASKEKMRCYWPESERIIFAEHFDSDAFKGNVFEPLRKYFDDERRRANVSPAQIMEYFNAHGWPKYGVARHSFSKSQWEFMTEESYGRLRQCFAELGTGGFLPREYEYLQREYEELRCEYEALRRPFSVTPEVPFTDIWNFAPVQFYRGKHVCEKPYPLMAHIIRSSSRPGATVLDAFAGSGVTGEVCADLGRDVVLIERDEHWYRYGKHRVAQAYARREELVTCDMLGIDDEIEPLSQRRQKFADSSHQITLF